MFPLVLNSKRQVIGSVITTPVAEAEIKVRVTLLFGYRTGTVCICEKYKYVLWAVVRYDCTSMRKTISGAETVKTRRR